MIQGAMILSHHTNPASKRNGNGATPVTTPRKTTPKGNNEALRATGVGDGAERSELSPHGRNRHAPKDEPPELPGQVDDRPFVREQVHGSVSSATAVGPLLQALGPLLPTGEAELCGRFLDALGRTQLLSGLELDSEAQTVVKAFLEEMVTHDRSKTGTLRPSVSREMGNTDSLLTVCRPLEAVKSVSDCEEKSGPLEDDEELPGQLSWLPLDSEGGFRRRCFVLFDDADASRGGKAIAFFVILTIIVSTVSFVLESIPELRQRPERCAELLAQGAPPTVEACEPRPLEFFVPIEAVCIGIFTFDYVVRISTVHAKRDKDTSALGATLRYARQPLTVVDLIAILPFYIDLCLQGGMAAVSKILRLLRILRLFKLAGRSPMFMMYAEVLVMSGQPLMILVFFNTIIVTLFGCLIFFAEGQDFSVDERFMNGTYAGTFTGVYVRSDLSLTDIEVTPFRSIPYALWWVAVTVTTVGYGDFSPTTRMGKLVGVFAFYIGIIFLALPISVLGQNFNVVYQRMMDSQRHRTIRAAGLDVNEAWRKSQASQPAGFGTSLRVSNPGDPSARGSPASKMLRRGSTNWLPAGRNVRVATFLLLEDPTSSRVAAWLSRLMMIAIAVSTLSFIIESIPEHRSTPSACLEAARLTVENCEPVPDAVFQSIETVCIVFFSIDYVIRIVCVHATLPSECGLKSNRVYSGCGITFAYARQPLNIIDFAAIVPFYAQLVGVGGGGASVLRVLRLIRVFRVMKMPRLKTCVEMFLNTFVDAAPALFILLMMSSLACVFFSSCIYIAEGTLYSVDPEVVYPADLPPEGAYIRPTKIGYGMEVSPFSSIPYSFWWFFTTSTTVGYGDDYPTTTMGRLVAVGVFCTGIILLALPITIVGGSFGKYYDAWVKEYVGLDGEDEAHDSVEDCSDEVANKSADNHAEAKGQRGQAWDTREVS